RESEGKRTAARPLGRALPRDQAGWRLRARHRLQASAGHDAEARVEATRHRAIPARAHRRCIRPRRGRPRREDHDHAAGRLRSPHVMATTTAIRRPLEGMLVLDLGQIYNGPYCGLLLGFMGARVLKIESPEGDIVRRRKRQVEPYPLVMLNSNKES